MFDLFRSRDKAVRLLLGGLLVMVALSMLIYLIPGAGMPSSGGASGSEIVATVADDTVTVRDIQRIVQDKLQSRQMPPEMMQYLLPQLIDTAISDRALAYQAKRMGFRVSDADLAEALRGQPGVANMPADQYRAFIEQNYGQSVAEFEENIRKGLYALQLQQLNVEGVVVTPQEIESEYRRRNEKAKIEYVAFDPAKIKTEIKPTAEQLQAYFQTVKGQFSVPETRTLRLVVADPQRVEETIQVTDAQVQQYYISHKDQFRTPERVKERHILLMTTNKSKDEVAKIRAKADDLLKQVKSGGDFAALAKQYSEDPGSKDKGGDLGWVVRGQMVPNFEKASFSLKPGEISDIVTTEYGFHIVQVQEKQEARLQPLDEVRPQIATELKKNGLNEKTQNLADQARTEIAKAPQQAEQIAQKLGLSFAKAEKIKAGDPLPFIGADKGVSDAAFGIKKGEVSPVVQAANRLAVVVVDEINPSHPADFADVEAQVRDRYQNEEGTKQGLQRAKEAGDMLKANGGDLAAVAKKFNVPVKTSDFFSRQGAVEGIGSASYFSDAFTQPTGTVFGPINTGTLSVVGKIADKQEPDAAKLTAERDSILMQLKQKKAEERKNLFVDSVMEKLIAEKKVRKNREVINQLIARYSNRSS